MPAQLIPQLIVFAVFLGGMYFFLIRPQKKKEKNIQTMRNNIRVGDEIITIGGICGKVVKTKENTIVIQVGADKVKFEMTRWSVSQVVSPAKDGKNDVVKEEKEEKKVMPKKLKRAEKPAEEKAADDKAVEEAKKDAEPAEPTSK